MKNVLIVPADPRYPTERKPLVTNEMKAVCIGEYSVPVDMPCECDGADECNLCDATGFYTYHAQIPWTTMKDIYKKMATVAANHKQ